MRLLVIEDEEKTSGYLRNGLSENGFIVDTSSDGEEGLELARQSAYDLVILDVLLPRREGWSVLRELRRTGNQTPVLLLSAIGSVDARVRGLGLGADDYLVKPFSFSELLARIRSILRRAPARQPELLRVSDLEVDIPHFKASRGESASTSRPRSFNCFRFWPAGPAKCSPAR